MKKILEEKDIEDDIMEEHEYVASYNLNSYGIDFDVHGLVRRLNDEKIYLPSFQRNYVWEPSKASRFIESLLLGLPIPSICLYKEEDNKQIIIDGYQRLETIRSFYNKSFPNGKVFSLSGVNPILNGKTIDDLDYESRLKLEDTLIHATIVKADEPQDQNYNAVYLIFERLNTGGVNLTAQEIRNCVYHGSFQEIIKSLSNNKDYIDMFNISQTRKKNEEIILRLFGLCLMYKDYSGNMKEFLNCVMEKHILETEDSLSTDIKCFKKTLKAVSSLDIALFKPNGKLNLAILDGVFVGTYYYLLNKQLDNPEKYKKSVKKLITSKDFVKNIETGKTHHTSPLKERIELSIAEIKKSNE